MPNRMLRDWTQSEKIALLSVHAERYFTRLIMKADDYGCFFANTSLLKANLFPLVLDSVREADITRWTAECQKAGLIVLYGHETKQYLQILDFKQRLDKARSKFPLPPDNLVVNDSVDVVHEVPAETELEKKLNTKTNTNAPEGAEHTPEEIQFFKNFQTYITNSTPNVGKMKEPFTIDQYVKLKKDFATQQITEMLLKMHNYKPLVAKNVSANLTFRNWFKKDFNNSAGDPVPGANKPNLSQAVKNIENNGN